MGCFAFLGQNGTFTFTVNVLITGKYDETRDPKREAGLFSVLTFWWMGEVLKTGAERPLEESDFLPLQEDDAAESLTTKLRTLWKEEEKRCSPGQGTRPKLWKCLIKAVSWGDYAKVILSRFADSTFRLMYPMIFGLFLLELTSSRHDNQRPQVYIYPLALLVAALSKSLALHQGLHRSRLLGMQSRTAVTGFIYQKARKLLFASLRTCLEEERR